MHARPDVVAFGDVYRQEYGAIALVAGATAGSWVVGEDLAQEAFARAHRQWSDIAALDRPGAWIRRVAINLALNDRRSRHRERRALERLPESVSATGTAEMVADRAVWAAVAALPPKQRAAIALHYGDGWSTADIADALDTSVSAVTTSLHKARATLAALLEEDA